MSKRRMVKRRNPEALALQHAIFRQRVKPSGKVYSRKGRKKETE